MVVSTIIILALFGGLFYFKFYHQNGKNIPASQLHKTSVNKGRKAKASMYSVKSRKQATDKKVNAYHSVEIHPHTGSCSEAKALKGKLFLSVDAPGLPIDLCTHKNCHCDFIHHDDRREVERRNDIGLQHNMYEIQGKEEHRHHKKDRRQNSV
ncbi:MAG: hypothetical protein HRU20_08600 [Pseudomonadales bacterium]|nr:hypothetical protein [Pseudomonadales bacterium]